MTEHRLHAMYVEQNYERNLPFINYSRNIPSRHVRRIVHMPFAENQKNPKSQIPTPSQIPKIPTIPTIQKYK